MKQQRYNTSYDPSIDFGIDNINNNSNVGATQNQGVLQTNLNGFFDIAKELGTDSLNRRNRGFAGTGYRTDQELTELYINNWMVSSVINLLAEDMTRQGFNITQDNDGIIKNYLQQKRFNEALLTAVKYVLLYGGSIIYMVIDDGKLPNEPVNLDNIRNIVKFKVYSKADVKIKSYYRDYTDNYDEPEYFSIYTNNELGEITVHESRCLIFNGEQYPYNLINFTSYEDTRYWGFSILQPMYEALEEFSIACSSLAKVIEKSNVDVLKLCGLASTLKQKDGLDAIRARARVATMSKSSANMILIDDGESYDSVAQNFNGLANVFEKMQETVTGAIRIPSRIFWDKSKGTWNAGDNEVRIYYDRIRSKQEMILLPVIRKLVNYIYDIKDLGLQGERVVNIEFNSLWQLDDQEKVKMRNTQAATDSLYIDKGVLSPREVREARYGGNGYSIETYVSGDIAIENNPESEVTSDITEKE